MIDRVRRHDRLKLISAWIAVGVILDALALSICWRLLEPPELELWIVQSWRIMVALVVVPWLVHVLALPLVLGVPPEAMRRPRGLLSVLVSTPAYLVLGLLVIPWGLYLTLLLGLIAPFLLEFRSDYAVMRLAAAIGLAVFDLILGCATGFSLYAMRHPFSDMPGQTAPKPTTDLAGGAIAASLFTVADWFGVLHLVPDDLRGMYWSPSLLTFVTLGVVSLLPHLLLLAWDSAKRS